MKKILLAVLLIAQSASADYAHRSNPSSPLSTANVITANGTCPLATVGVSLVSEGTNTIFVKVSGTWTGTLSFLGSNDAFVSTLGLAAYPFSTTTGVITGAAVNTTTANGTWLVNNPSLQRVAVCATASMTGSASVRIDADPADFMQAVVGVAGAPIPVQLGTNTAQTQSGTLTTITTDTVALPITGAQWATVQFKATVAGTSKQNAQVSIDGGTNWFSPAYAKKLSAVSANPTFTDFSVSGGVTLGANDLWEVPLPGNATNFRLICGTTGTATTVTLSGGAVYVPGVPVVATLFDVTSGVAASNPTGVLDLSGWKSVFMAYTSGGATTGDVTMAQPADDGVNIGGSFNVVTAATASKQLFTRENSVPTSNAAITKRNTWTASAVAAQQTRLRLEAYR